MKFYEYICSCLNAYGCKQAFGVPGSLIMPVWQNLAGITLTLCSHEQEAGYVASGYAKMSRKLTAVITTGSPGVANSVTGIAGANMDSVPVIYISGKADQNVQNTGTRQEESRTNRMFESTDLMSPITKLSLQITDISTAAEQFRLCCETAVSERAGSVHISIPLNIQLADLPQLTTIKRDSISNTPFPDIPACRKPLIIMGWGCYVTNAEKDVYALAERIHAPVLVTSKAYCCIQQLHPNYLGKLGYGYGPYLESFLKEYSATDVFSFGCSMSRKDLSPSCASILKRASVYIYTCECDDVKTRFDAKLFFEATNLSKMIRNWLQKLPKKVPPDTLYQKINHCKQMQAKYFRSVLEQSDTMALAIDEISKLGKNITITADAGNNLLNTAVLCTPDAIGGIFLNDGIRSMGSGVCETVGMAIANPNRYYVSIIGDGGMLMNGSVLYLAERLHLPVAFVVMNNSSLGRVRIGQTMTHHYIGSDLGNISFSMYARAFGMESFVTDKVDILMHLLNTYVLKKHPVLIELLTDKDEIPLKLKLEGVS